MSLSLEVAELPADAIEVGRITDAWGVKGWIKILPYSSDPQAFFSSKRWYLLPPEPRAGVVIKFDAFTGTQLLKVREAKAHNDAVVASSEMIADRTDAENLKGVRIFVPRSSFPTPQKDEFYWVDLMDLSVVNREGAVLGTVIDLHATGPQTNLVVELADKKTIMIPFVRQFVDEVDKHAKTIKVDWQLDYLD